MREPALKYLAVYVYRTALSSQRLLQEEHGRITLQYRDREHHQWHTLTLDAREFLRRFLQHVLPKGFQRVRYYGWLSPAAKARWERILNLLDYRPPALCLPAPSPPTCPCCGKVLRRMGTLARAPPLF